MGQDDGTLYGHAYDVYVLNVDASGVRMGNSYRAVFPDFGGASSYDRSTGLLYADDGRAFDPSTGVVAGTFNLRDLYPYTCFLDPAEPVVFFLGRDASQYAAQRGFTLRAFDKNTYRHLGDLPIPDATGKVQHLIRWGRAGVAFNTVAEATGDTAAVYLVDGTFINASAAPDFTGGTPVDALPVFTAMTPESATAGSADLVLTVSGSEFQSGATICWNGQRLTTAFHSSTELQAVVPASNLTQAGPATVSVANDSLSYAVNSLAFTILPASNGLIARNLSSIDIAWDAHSSRLYAPVWSVDSRYPNSVVAIDPASGSISEVAGVAPDPIMLRVSRDGTLGYTAYAELNLATQFRAPQLDSVTSWSLGADATYGPYVAMDLQPAPDSAQTTAIALGLLGFSAENQGLVIFDNGTARPQRPPRVNLFDTLQWGLTDSILYAADNESSGFELSTIGVDANGATLLRTDRDVLTRYWMTIHFDRGTGYLYADDGYATNPATGRHVGKYSAFGLVLPDSSLNRVFVLHLTSSYVSDGYAIDSFNQSNFTPVSSLKLPDLVGDPVALTRWGTSGLAIVTYNGNWGPTGGPAGMLYILDNPTFVSATQQVQPGIENLAVGFTWQPGRAAVSSPRSVERPADTVGKVSRPYPKPGTRAPIGRQN